MSVASLTVLVAVGGSCAIALVGWLVAAMNDRRTVRPSRRAQMVVSAIVVVLAGISMLLAPIIAVAWAFVALNFALGRREIVPFSLYPMFSRPAADTWALRYEDPTGQLVPIAAMGLDPVKTHKRFARELEVAHAEGITNRLSARRHAASNLARVLELHRPADGRLATTPIAIVMLEYQFAEGGITVVRTELATTSP